MSNVSVITCVKNEEERLERLLNSIPKYEFLELIVIDDKSDDDTIKIAQKYTDKIYSTEGRGLAYGRQLGAYKSNGKYLAYIDADMELNDPNTFSKMIKELEKYHWIAIQSQLVDPRKNNNFWAQGEDFHWCNRFNKPGERPFIGMGMSVIVKEIVLKYKFDYEFSGAAEDADFYARLKKEGYKFGVSKVIAYHYHRSSLKQFVKQRIWYGKGNAKAIIKHKAFLLFFTPFGIGLYGSLLSIYKRKPKFILFYLLWMIFLFYGTFVGFVTLNKN